MGRPLGDLAHDFVDTDLVRIASHVRKQRVRVDDEAACYDGRIFLRHITPYQSDDDHIGGVVITFIEITEQKQAELTLEQQLADRTRVRSVLHDITRMANEAQTSEEAMRAALERLAQYHDWQVGHVWQLAEDGSEQAISSGIFYTPDRARVASEQLEVFQQLCRQWHFARGQGVIGTVMETGQPIWMDDIEHLANWQRKGTESLGLHAGGAFPVTVDGQVVAVLEFYSDRPEEGGRAFHGDSAGRWPPVGAGLLAETAGKGSG